MSDSCPGNAQPKWRDLRLLPVILILLWAVPLRAGDPAPETLLEEGRWKLARRLLESKLAKAPDAPTYYLLARTWEAEGEYETAVKLAEKAVALDRENADYHCLLGNAYGRIAEKGGVLKGLGMARRFRKENEAALAINPRHLEALYAEAMFYWNAPGIIGGDKKKAHAIAGEMAGIDRVRGLLLQADIAQREKKITEAERLYREAVQADPRRCDARMALASFYASPQQKKYGQAEREAAEVLHIDVARLDAYCLLARLLAANRRWPELDNLLAQAEREAPEDLLPYRKAAEVIQAGRSDPERAQRYLRKAQQR